MIFFSFFFQTFSLFGREETRLLPCCRRTACHIRLLPPLGFPSDCQVPWLIRNKAKRRFLLPVSPRYPEFYSKAAVFAEIITPFLSLSPFQRASRLRHRPKLWSIWPWSANLRRICVVTEVVTVVTCLVTLTKLRKEWISASRQGEEGEEFLTRFASRALSLTLCNYISSVSNIICQH